MNSVDLFNSLTHFGNNNVVNEKVFIKLMNKFEQYLFLKKIIKKDMKITSYIENDYIYYKLIVKDNIETILKLNNNVFKYKKKKYIVQITKINDNELKLCFLRKIKINSNV